MTCPDLSSSAPVYPGHGPGVHDPEHGGAEPGGLEGQMGCPLPIDTTIIRMLIDAPTRAKHKRFAAINSNPLLRECPADGCTKLVQPSVNWRGVIQPDMICNAPGCDQTFCYFHSAAHPGRTCREYEQAIRDEQRANRAAIALFTKPCPQCNVPTEKNNGCNHMTCQGCGQDWCWICGRKCDGGGYPTHYAWWNVFGCPGTQMQDRYQHWSCCGQCGLRCSLFLYKLLLVVLVVPATVLALAVTVACLPGLLISVPVVYCCCDDDCEDDDSKLFFMVFVRSKH
jgi:hypothetical protein